MKQRNRFGTAIIHYRAGTGGMTRSTRARLSAPSGSDYTTDKRRSSCTRSIFVTPASSGHAAIRRQTCRSLPQVSTGLPALKSSSPNARSVFRWARRTPGISTAHVRYLR